MENRFDFPFLGYGLGLRSTHYPYILEHRPDVDWFEIISENFIDTDGRPRRKLAAVREHYPVVMHGVSLSIGTVDPLDSNYLEKLKALIDEIDPPWVSDHLCWTGIAHRNSHDLLPVPYTEEALAHIVGRIKRVQDYIGMPLVLENPSSYLEFTASTMPEWEFIARMAEEAECGLLLDANNVYVSCFNHRWDPETYIDALPLDRVAQIHLAGHSNNGTHIVDTHDDHVIDEVWTLYSHIVKKAGRELNTMIEWDAKIPEFPVLYDELQKAKRWAEEAAGPVPMPRFPTNADNIRPRPQPPELEETFSDIMGAILGGQAETMQPEENIVPKLDFSPAEQIGVYIRGYRYRLYDTIYDDTPALRQYLGREKFAALVDAYIEATPSRHFNISRYIEDFPDFVKRQGAAPFACELALLETAIARLFDDIETPALTQDDLYGLTPDILMDSKMRPRAALKIFAFAHPVNAYYNDVMDDGIETPEVPDKKPCFLAVYRHDDMMWRLELEEREYLLLAAMFSGLTVGAALNAVLPDEDDAEDAAKLTHWFSRWISHGLLSELRR